MFYCHLFFFVQARRSALARLHPSGLSDSWADRLRGRVYVSDAEDMTHEHYLQISLTSVAPLRGPALDGYEYTLHSHTYEAGEGSFPMVRVQYDLAPVQVVITEHRQPFYKFITSLCAIVGGVYTVAGMLDGSVHHVKSVIKKVELGKQY
jgi:hypothetical protein